MTSWSGRNSMKYNAYYSLWPAPLIMLGGRMWYKGTERTRCCGSNRDVGPHNSWFMCLEYIYLACCSCLEMLGPNITNNAYSTTMVRIHNKCTDCNDWGHTKRKKRQTNRRNRWWVAFCIRYIELETTVSYWWLLVCDNIWGVALPRHLTLTSVDLNCRQHVPRVVNLRVE